MFEQLKTKVERGTLVAVLVAGLSLCVIAFLGIACFLSLTAILPASLAALVTASAAIIIIAVILVLAKLIPANAQKPRRHSGIDSNEQAFEALLREQADPALTQWVRSHPDKAALMTLVLGVAAGYNQAARRVLLDTYVRWAAARDQHDWRRQVADRYVTTEWALAPHWIEIALLIVSATLLTLRILGNGESQAATESALFIRILMSRDRWQPGVDKEW